MLAWLALSAGCSKENGQAPRTTTSSAVTAPSLAKTTCPSSAPAPEQLPGTRPEHRSLEHWLEQLGSRADEPLMTVRDIRLWNEAVGLRPATSDGDNDYSRVDLYAPVDPEAIREEVGERLQTMHERMRSGAYVDADGDALDEDATAMFRIEHLSGDLEPALRVALEPMPLRCGPRDAALYKAASVGAYNRNACSTVQPQEPVQILARWPNGMRLARTSYSLGWLDADAELSPVVPRRLQRAYLEGARMRMVEESSLEAPDASATLPADARLPVAPDHDSRVLLATTDGFTPARVTDVLRPLRRPLTREALLRRAFEDLGRDYGYGGDSGGVDCSRYLMNVFESFDIRLPRHSGWQAQAGSFGVPVEGLPERQKLQLLDMAHEHGAVLLHFPGHIMLYLGRDARGEPMAIHSLGEYVEPCSQQDGETVYRVGEVVVSNLALGEGSSRRSFLQRLTHLVVFGKAPDARLRDIAEMRPAGPIEHADTSRCKDSKQTRIFHSPRWPSREQRLRVIATGREHPAPARLFLLDPRGRPVDTEVRHLGGPPFSSWASLEPEIPGTWTALVADGRDVVACQRIRVQPHRFAPPEPETPPAPEDPVWQPEASWERDTENLYAAFVERLFEYPPDDGRTWSDLHSLLRDPEHNLLYDHLGRDEDEKIELQPDCADLPYALRAYFAWKLRLPFGLRRCSRGSAGVPPRCGELRSNLTSRDLPDPVDAFEKFANRDVAWGVHSASGRTHPKDEETDFYPVELTREALVPGVPYADPHGHVMLIVGWYPQGREPDDYGVLMAAEAQPDGTISRRRFWRGSFLFTPKTQDVGAGFKAFRPVMLDEETGVMHAMSNAKLERAQEFPRYSLEQYRGSVTDFYDRMQTLINPRPLDPQARLVSLIDALEEQVQRRVISIDNGERFMAERSYEPIEMPHGYAIFETSGPWEDYSTPARDMRLLIAIDTVRHFPKQVARRPAHFGLEPDEVDATIRELEARMPELLKKRRFSYTRSDATTQTLTLEQIVDRVDALELAYNPNDCVEIRWAAPEGSEERASCDRHAPIEQRRRMESYRPWFRARQRPPREE